MDTTPSSASTRRRRSIRLGSLVAGVAIVVALTGCESAAQAHGLSVLNASRTSRGLTALQPSYELDAKAQAWAEHLAAAGRLSHNQLTAGVSFCFRGLAENVGYGRSIEEVEAAFIADIGINPPQHRINIRNPNFDHVGIGVAFVNGQYWVVQDFADAC